MSLLTYEATETVATLAMDDGKVNALSLAMQAELNAALDRAEAQGLAVLLAGRDGVFSAGFDLKTLSGGGVAAADMLDGGFKLARRLLAFPHPVVMACTGHCMAMGLFLLLSGDHRVGAAGADHKIVANEVAIGLPMPRTPIEICRLRLAPNVFERAMICAELFTPDTAITGGFLDELTPAGAVLDAARARAEHLAGLSRTAFTATKLRMHESALAAVDAAIAADDADVRKFL